MLRFEGLRSMIITERRQLYS